MYLGNIDDYILFQSGFNVRYVHAIYNPAIIVCSAHATMMKATTYPPLGPFQNPPGLEDAAIPIQSIPRHALGRLQQYNHVDEQGWHVDEVVSRLV